MQSPTQDELQLPVDGELILSLIHFGHATELFALIEASRSSLRQWLPWVDFVVDMGDLMQLISYYRHKLANNGALTACIFYRERLAGIIGLNAVHWTNRSATIGYWLGETYRGKGIMRRACSRLIDYAFFDMRLHKIHILCAVGNTASQRIPTVLDFRREGLLRDGEWLNDRYVDLYSYGMLRKNWRVASPTEEREAEHRFR